MRRAFIGIGVVAAVGVGVVAVSSAQQAPAAPAAVRVVLQQADLSVPGREMVQARGDFPVGAGLPLHTHFGEEIGYLLEGTVTLEVKGQALRTLKAGDVFLIPPGTPHTARNAGTTPAKVLATYVVEKGKPLVTPVP
jgi:quercetin dioxygenase-like cupin family protein